MNTTKPLYHVAVDFSNDKTHPTKKVDYLKQLQSYFKTEFPEFSWIITDERISITNIGVLSTMPELTSHQQLMLDNMNAPGNTIIETSRQSGSSHTVLHYIESLLNDKENYLIRLIGRNSCASRDMCDTLCEFMGLGKSGTKFPRQMVVGTNTIQFLGNTPHISDLKGYSYKGVVDIYDNHRVDSDNWGQLICENYGVAQAMTYNNNKIVMVRTGSPDRDYRRAVLTGKLGNVVFPNRLKMDHAEMALLNEEDCENLPECFSSMFDVDFPRTMLSRLGPIQFSREYRMHLHLMDRDKPPYVE